MDHNHDEVGKRHYFMEVAYDGTDYYGWQTQSDKITVQQTIEERLTKLHEGIPVKIEGSGRTDAGVHALGMGVTFTTPTKPHIPLNGLEFALNNILPKTIRVRGIRESESGFHARFDAKGKAYTYVVNRGYPSPFTSKFSWKPKRFEYLDEIRKTLDFLSGTHDFSAFTAQRNNIDDAVRTIYRVDMDEFDQYLCFTFIGNGFLYKMIRVLMGTIGDVARGKLALEDVKWILDSKSIVNAGKTAPPQGLFLMKVFYEDDAWKDFKLQTLPYLYVW